MNARLVGFAIVVRKPDGREVILQQYAREEWANRDATLLLDLGTEVVVRTITRDEESPA